MARICSTFTDHQRAQRAVDQLVDAGFAPADVYIDPAAGDAPADPAALPGSGRQDDGQGVLQSIGHAVASVAGMDTPDAQARPFVAGQRRGGTLVLVDVLGDGDVQRAMRLLRAAGGMDVHQAGRRVPEWPSASSSTRDDEDAARSAEAERGRTVERALAADQAGSGRAWDAEAPVAGGAERRHRGSAR